MRNSEIIITFCQYKKDSAISSRVFAKYQYSLVDYYMTLVTLVTLVNLTLSITWKKRYANRTFTSVIALIICVVGSLGVVNLNRFICVTDLVSMSKGKIKTICPACMSGKNFRIDLSGVEFFLVLQAIQQQVDYLLQAC